MTNLPVPQKHPIHHSKNLTLFHQPKKSTFLPTFLTTKIQNSLLSFFRCFDKLSNFWFQYQWKKLMIVPVALCASKSLLFVNGTLFCSLLKVIKILLFNGSFGLFDGKVESWGKWFFLNKFSFWIFLNYKNFDKLCIFRTHF